MANVGLHDESEVARRESIATDLVDADVELLVSEWGPKVIESEVEEELAVPGLIRLLINHEEDYDAFVVGCFGDPGVRALQELTDKPIVGPAMASYHTAAQIVDEFSVLNIVERSESVMQRTVRDHGLESRLASVRTLGISVDEIDHDSPVLVEKMISTGQEAVKEDEAGALIPGCMGLAFMQVHDEIGEDLGIPFLDPVSLALETARSWARHGVTQCSSAALEFPRSRIEFLQPLQ